MVFRDLYLSDEDYEQLMLAKIKTKRVVKRYYDALKQYIQAFTNVC